MLGLKVPFGIDGAGYRRGLNTMRGQTKQWSNGIKGLVAGAFAFSAVLQGWNAMLEKMDRIHKLSQQLGVSMRGLQQVDLVAQLSGADLEQVTKAMGKFLLNAQKAKDGTKTLEVAFDRLGVSSSEVLGLDLPGQILALSKAYANANNKTTAQADLLTILGTRAQEIMPLIKQAPEVLAEGFDKAAVASDRTIEKIAQFNDTLTTVKQNAMVFGTVLFDAVSGALISATSAVVGFMGAIAKADTALGKVWKSDGLVSGLRAFGETFKNEISKTGDLIAKQWEAEEPVKKLKIDTSAAQAEAQVELEKLLSDLHDKEAAHAQSMMTLEERRIELLEERARLEGEVSEETAEGVKAKLAVLAIDKELASNKSKSQAASDAIATGDKALEERVAEFKFKQLSPEDQLAAINKRLADNKETFGQLGKGKERTDLGNKIQDDIEARASLLGGLEPSEDSVVSAAGAAVVSSSLASIGGGAGAFVAIADPKLEEAKRHGAKFDQMVASLNEISGNTSGTSGNVNKNLNV